MPSKPAKCGLSFQQIFAAYDVNTSYALNMHVYTGKPVRAAPEKSQDATVVLRTWRRITHITCDNFFTNYNLGQELLKRKLTMVGTV